MRRLLPSAALALLFAACFAKPDDNDDDVSDIPLLGSASGGGTGGTTAGGSLELDCIDHDAGSDLGAAILAGSTLSAMNDWAFCTSGGDGGGGVDTGYYGYYDYGYGDYTGRDTTIGWRAPSSGTFTATTVGSRFDTMLTALADSCEGRVLDCNDDFSGLQSSVSFTVDAGDVVVLVLDGFSSYEYGDWQLNLYEGGPSYDDYDYYDYGDYGYGYGYGYGVTAGGSAGPAAPRSACGGGPVDTQAAAFADLARGVPPAPCPDCAYGL